MVCLLLALSTACSKPPGPPNILFIAVDDLNDWTGFLGGRPQALTPNIDRLARSGVVFTNAHTAAPACNPSRTAIFTGRSPHRSGLYDNRQKMREALPGAAWLITDGAENPLGYFEVGDRTAKAVVRGGG